MVRARTGLLAYSNRLEIRRQALTTKLDPKVPSHFTNVGLHEYERDRSTLSSVDASVVKCSVPRV